jgi:hypothetical protein
LYTSVQVRGQRNAASMPQREEARGSEKSKSGKCGQSISQVSERSPLSCCSEQPLRAPYRFYPRHAPAPDSPGEAAL